MRRSPLGAGAAEEEGGGTPGRRHRGDECIRKCMGKVREADRWHRGEDSQSGVMGLSDGAGRLVSGRG